MRKYPQLIAAFVLLMTACKKDETTTPTTTPPTTTTSVKAGSVFTYKHSDYDNDFGTTLVATTQYTLTMLRDSTIGSDKWFVVERKDNGALTGYGLMRFTSGGVYNMTSGGAKMSLKLNAAVNDTWVDNSNQTCVIKSTNQSVTVPKGNFTDAYYMESSDANSLENKIWYNNNEYMLRNEEYDESPITPGTMILDYRDELVSIQL